MCFGLFSLPNSQKFVSAFVLEVYVGLGWKKKLSDRGKPSPGFCTPVPSISEHWCPVLSVLWEHGVGNNSSHLGLPFMRPLPGVVGGWGRRKSGTQGKVFSVKRQLRACKTTHHPCHGLCLIGPRWKYSAHSSRIKNFSPRRYLGLSLQRCLENLFS